MPISSANRQAFINTLKKTRYNAQKGYELLIKKGRAADYFDDLIAEGLFAPNSSPKPEKTKNGYHIVFWEALPYLEEVARISGKEADHELAKKLLDIIRSVTGKKADNFYTWSSFVKIFSLVPLESLSFDDVRQISIWLESRFDSGLTIAEINESLLPKLLSDDSAASLKKACIVLECCLAIKSYNANKRISDELAFKADNYWTQKLVEQHIKDFGQKCGKQTSAIFSSKLNEVFSKERSDLSWHIRPAIEEHDQNHHWKVVENTLVAGLRESMRAWLNTSDPEAEEFLVGLLDSDSKIHSRIAIYLVNELYDNYSFLVEKCVSRMSSIDHLHELYNLLKDRFENFTEANKQNTIDHIKSIEISEEIEDSERIKRIEQLKWLSAIKGKGSKEANLLFSELDACTDIGLSDHPDFLSYMETRYVADQSPYTPAELLVYLQEGRIVEVLNSFEEQRSWHAPTIRGLTNSLISAVESKPLLFHAKMKEFRELDVPYQYSLVEGFKKAFENNAAKGWSNIWGTLFSHIKFLVTNPSVWDSADKEGYGLTPTKFWLAGSISELFRTVCRKDSSPLSDNEFVLMLDVIRTLLEESLLKHDWDEDNDDYLTQAINLPRGKAIEALISYSLRRAREEDKNTKIHVESWVEVVSIFDSELTKSKTENYEFSAIIAAHLPQIYYLSPTWVESNILRIFPKDNLQHIKAALHGFSYVGAYRKIYQLLCKNGIIAGALALNIDQKFRSRYVDLVALAYLWGDEELDSENFKKLFNDDDLCKVAQFFWSAHNDKLSPEQIERIFLFWDKCVDWINDSDSKQSQLLSYTGSLIVYLDSINKKQAEWLSLAAKHVGEYYNAIEFTQGLSKLVEASPQEVFQIFEILIEHHRPYTDYKGYIETIVLTLAEKGYKDEAYKILDGLAGLRGVEGLFQKIRNQRKSE